jgi:hypothetical protein
LGKIDLALVKMKRTLKILLPTLLLVFSQYACGLPGKSTPTSDAGAALFTQAAQTVAAQMTNVYRAKTREPKPIETSQTATPAATSIPPVTNVPASPTLSPCDQVTYISDVSIPDGSRIGAGNTFTKKWLLKNSGSCTWTPSYAAVFASGEKMAPTKEIYLTGNVSPGQTFELSIDMTAPLLPGKYVGYWKMRNANSNMFGLSNGQAFYVSIEVPVGSATSTPGPGSTLVYDFSTYYCSATWSSEAGDLTCPGDKSDSAGFVVKIDNPIIETGSTAGAVALETHPLSPEDDNWNGDGSIQGVFPAIPIKDGYHFKSQIGCLENADTCNVNFHLDYSLDGTNLSPLGSWNESYDDSIRNLDINLSSLAGKKVQLFLSVDADSDEGDDQAIWIFPRITK